MILLGRALEAFIMECGLRFNRVPLVTKSLMALAAVLLIATPALAMGMVGVSGEDLTIDGERASGLGGVDESTALIFALQAYCHGQVEDWGRNMNFPGPDTGQLDCDSLLELWHQYFWLCDHYDLGLVRIGASDMWGSKVMHEAWLWHRAAFMDVLSTMLHEAEEHGVYVCLVLAGSQQYPLYAFGGSGSVLDSSSQAYANYISYCTDVISNVDAMNSTAALFSYDVWNEPDHLSVNKAYWAGDQLMFILAKEFRPELIVFCADVDGIHTADPNLNPEAKLIERVDQGVLDSLPRTARVKDVTGSIYGKVEAMLRLAELGRRTMVINGKVPGRLQSALRGEKVKGSVVDGGPR